MKNLEDDTVDTGDILIVDDMMVSLKILENILLDSGYRVRCANDGMEALKQIEEQLPELILLDIQMPGIDGYEVCRRLKSGERANQIPVIFLSALDDDEAKVKGFAVGGADFITKPYNPPEILFRIKTHLSLSRMHQRLEERVAERTAELTRKVEEHQRAEEALRKSEKQFRTIIEKSPLPMLVIDGRHRIKLCNTKFHQMFGYTQAEVAASEDCWKLWCPEEEYRDQIRQEWESALAKGAEPHSDIDMLEAGLTTKNGSMKTCEFHTVSLGDFYLLVINEISGRKVAS